MPVITALFDTIYYSSLPADEREECEVRFDGDEIVVSKPSGSGLSMQYFINIDSEIRLV